MAMMIIMRIADKGNKPRDIFLGLALACAVLLTSCQTTPHTGQMALTKKLDKVEGEVMAAEEKAQLKLAEKDSDAAVLATDPLDAQNINPVSKEENPDPALHAGSEVPGTRDASVIAAGPAQESSAIDSETSPPHRDWNNVSELEIASGISNPKPVADKTVVASALAKLEAELQVYLKNQRYAEAYQWLEKTQNLDASSRSYLTKLIQDSLLRKTLVLSEQLKSEKRYYTAFRLIQQSRLESRMSDVLSQIVEAGAPFYLTQSQLRYEMARTATGVAHDLNLARAYLEAFKALQMRPESTTAQTWYERCRGEMQPTLIAKVMVGGVMVNGKRGGNASRYFANRLRNEIQLPFGFQLENSQSQDDAASEPWVLAETQSSRYLVTAQVSNTLSDENLAAWIRSSSEGGMTNTSPILGVGEAFISILDLSQSTPVMVETPPLSISLRIRDFPGVSFSPGSDTPIVQARNTVERELLSQLADGVQIYVQRAFDNRARQRLLDWRDLSETVSILATPPESMIALASGILYCRELGLQERHPVRRQLEEVYLQRLTERDFLE